jgi:hypothetical protein
MLPALNCPSTGLVRVVPLEPGIHFFQLGRRPRLEIIVVEVVF